MVAGRIKDAGRARRWRAFSRRGGILFFATALASSLFSGCSAPKAFTDSIIGPGFVVTNVFRKEATLPAEIRRVAVMPLTSSDLGNTTAGREALEPIFHTELTKTARFDLVFLTPGDLQKWTGKERWDYHDVLPRDLLEAVAKQTGADGIIFPRLTRFHAYPPMVIGWHVLLAGMDADILWTVEEVFDAAEEPVSNSARRYDRARVRNNPVLEDSRSILLSPRKFGQYTAHAIVETLPKR